MVPGRAALVRSRITSAAAKITAPPKGATTVLFHSLSSLLLHEENSPVDVARDAVQCWREFHVTTVVSSLVPSSGYIFSILVTRKDLLVLKESESHGICYYIRTLLPIPKGDRAGEVCMTDFSRCH